MVYLFDIAGPCNNQKNLDLRPLKKSDLQNKYCNVSKKKSNSQLEQLKYDF